MRAKKLCPVCHRRPATVEPCCGATVKGECPCWDYEDEHPAGPRVCFVCYRKGGF